MRLQSRLFMLSGFILLTISCGSKKVIHPETDWQTVYNSCQGKEVFLAVADILYPCKIVEIRPDHLVIQHDTMKLTIPANVVSRVRMDSGGRGRGYRIAGALIGGALGATAGYFVGKKLTDSTGSAIGHPVSVGLMLGGAIGGAWLGGGRKTETYYPFSQTITRYVLHEEVGEDIILSEIKMFSLFEDLRREPEEILLMQILKYDGSKYMLLYDLKTAEGYDVKWKEVDEAYLDSQRKKITDKLK